MKILSTILIVLLAAGALLAESSVKTQPDANRAKYIKIKSLFENADMMKVNMQMDRNFFDKSDMDEPDQIFTFLYTKSDYLKIDISELHDETVIQKRVFYFTPDGKLAVAEMIEPGKIRKAFLFSEDNPALFMETNIRAETSAINEDTFQELPSREEKNALALLSDSVGYYNATKEFIDNLPSS